MKKRKVPGIDEVRRPTERRDAAGEVKVSCTKRLLKVCKREGSISDDWRTGLIVSIWKRKSDAQDLRKYRGITILSHVFK